MRGVVLLFIVAALSKFGVSARYASAPFYKFSEAEIIDYACSQTLLSQATFCSTGSCYCTNINYEGSLLYCAYDLASSDEAKEKFNEYLTYLCPNLDADDFESVYENATNYLVNISDISDFDTTSVINYPIYYDEFKANSYVTTFNMFFKSYHYSFYYGGALVAYFFAIFFIAGINFWFSKLFPSQIIAINRSLQQSSIIRMAKKHVTIPALFDGKHTTPIQYIAGYWPTRSESILIGIFYIVSFIFHFPNYGHHVQHGLLFGTKVLYLSRVIGDRSGIISTFLIILTFFLAGRNNFFLWWTGWKQSTFLAIHKAVARVCVISAVVHTIGYTIYYVYGNYYESEHTEQYWIWGSVATVAGCVILFQAIGKLRAWNYEVFLYLHFALALIFLVGAWIHLKYMEFQAMLYPMAAVWAFDRFVRLVRILWFGVRTAHVSVLTDSVMKITVPKHNYWKSYPGAYGYVYFMRPTLFWQSHPFSIIESEDGKSLHLYVSVKKGATKTVMDYLQSHDDKSAEMKLLFEGPYGSSHSMDHYEVPIFYGSNTGIPGLYPYIKSCLTSKNSKVKSAKLNWIVRDMDTVNWFRDELIFLQQFENLETIVYLTRQTGNDLSEHSSSEELDKKFNTTKEYSYQMDSSIDAYKSILPNVVFKFGRPDIESLIREDVSNFSGKDICITTCGNNTICDQARRTIADISKDRINGVLDYVEELETW